MTAATPECVYDSARRSISSSGPLHMQIAEGKFSIEGEGFLFQQTNSTLWVSNRVHTILHPELLSRQATATNISAAARKPTAAAEETSGMDIFSDQFTYSEESGQGVYEGNVRVTGTNLTSTGGKLTIVLATPERQLKSLTAEQNVVVDYVTSAHERIQATGERAFYSADTDLVQMTGQPTWRVGQRDGSGDELIFDRTNNIFRANGHASLKMPAQGLGSSGLLSRSNTADANLDHPDQPVCRSPVRQLRTPDQPGGLSRAGARQRPPRRPTAGSDDLQPADAHLFRHE